MERKRRLELLLALLNLFVVLAIVYALPPMANCGRVSFH